MNSVGVALAAALSASTGIAAAAGIVSAAGVGESRGVRNHGDGLLRIAGVVVDAWKPEANLLTFL